MTESIRTEELIRETMGKCETAGRTELAALGERIRINAVTWLKYLLEENDRLKAERDDFKHGHIMLQKEIKAMREALELILENSAEDGIHYKLDRCYSTAYHTLRELSKEDTQ